MRGRLKVEVEQDDEGALPWLARAVENAPEWGWPAVNLGQILERARAKDDADLERRAVEALLVSRHRYAAMGFYRAAERARADGDTETAERLLEQALERDPDHAEARRLIRLVRIER
jgi:tetratricopeptide (TPR) repeat protein